MHDACLGMCTQLKLNACAPNIENPQTRVLYGARKSGRKEGDEKEEPVPVYAVACEWTGREKKKSAERSPVGEAPSVSRRVWACVRSSSCACWVFFVLAAQRPHRDWYAGGWEMDGSGQGVGREEKVACLWPVVGGPKGERRLPGPSFGPSCVQTWSCVVIYYHVMYSMCVFCTGVAVRVGWLEGRASEEIDRLPLSPPFPSLPTAAAVAVSLVCLSSVVCHSTPVAYGGWMEGWMRDRGPG